MALKPQQPMNGGTSRAMRERQRVEIVRNLLAAQGFLSISDMAAGVASETRVTEVA